VTLAKILACENAKSGSHVNTNHFIFLSGPIQVLENLPACTR
jgi:hypothetical protein